MTDELKAKIEAIRELANNTTIKEWRIASPNPQTMLEILAYIDQLEKEYAVKQDTIDQQNGIIAKLIKEVDWLAEFAVGGECPPEYEHARAGGAVVHCHHDCKECWKEAAEEAVETAEHGEDVKND